MDIGGNKMNPVVTGVSPNIETKAIRVLITTEDHEIDGFLHIKPGGYQSRVSDILNAKNQQYLPLTNATYRNVRHPDEPARKVETLIVRIDTIKMVAPHCGSELVSRETAVEAAANKEGICDEDELQHTGTDF